MELEGIIVVSIPFSLTRPNLFTCSTQLSPSTTSLPSTRYHPPPPRQILFLLDTISLPSTTSSPSTHSPPPRQIRFLLDTAFALDNLFALSPPLSFSLGNFSFLMEE